MQIPEGKTRSELFRNGAVRGLIFAQNAAFHDAHATGPHKMTAKQALRVVAASRGTMREIAKDLLAALTSQPVADVADFYRGFAYGIECQRKWSTSGGAPNPTWRVYMTLWQNWQRVERMASTTELCDWLTAQLDGNIVGSDPRRIQKICERIGLKLRARGRPSRK